MLETNKYTNKIIAYIMIGLLIMNLFSGSVQYEIVNAENEAQSISITGVDDYHSYVEKEKTIGYSFEGTYEGSVTYQYQVVKNGEPDNSWTSVGTASGSIIVGNSSEENVNKYKVTFRAVKTDNVVNNEVLVEKSIDFQLGMTEPNYSVSVDKDYAKDKVVVTYKSNLYDGYRVYREVLPEGGTLSKEEITFDGKDASDPYLYVKEETFDLSSYQDGKYTVSLYLDKNSSPLEKKEVPFVVDKTKPEISIETNPSDELGKNPITCTVKIDDANYTGCTVAVKVKRVTLEGIDYNKSFSYNTKDVDKATGKSFTCDQDGLYTVWVEAEDAAGNKDTTQNTGKEIKFRIDNSAPTLSISGVEEAKHYNETKEITFEAKDLNPDKDSYKVTVSKGGANPVEKGLTWKENLTEYDSESYTFTHKASLTFEEEGSYKVTFAGEDEANNEAVKKEISFVIDKTDPNIKVTDVSVNYQQGDKMPRYLSEEDTYYLSDGASLQFKVIELNWDKAEVYVNATKKYQENNTMDNQTLNMTKEEDVLSVPYDEEGTYHVEVQGKDAAGNLSINHKRNFVIDKTSPVFRIEGVDEAVEGTDGTAYQVGKELTFLVKDYNHDIDTYKVIVTKIDKTGTKTVTDMSQNVTWENGNSSDEKKATLALAEEGNYIVTVTGNDKAENEGNVAEAKFRVDKTAPVITLSTITNNAYYNETAQLNVLITEYNYKDTSSQIYVTRVLDGQTFEDVDSITLTGVNTNTPFSYSEEGVYDIRVVSTDAAGNAAIEKEIHFTVDKTKPELNISGVVEGYMTTDPVTLTYEAKDRNHDFSKYVISGIRSDLFGNESSFSSTYTVDEWSQTDYVAKKNISYSQEGKYEIAIDAIDLAGNVADTKKITFSIDHTAPVISNITYADADAPIAVKYQNIYSNQAIMIEFQVTDQVVGVNDSKVYVTVGDKTDKKSDTTLYVAHKAVGNYYYVYIPTDLAVAEFDDTVTIWANDLLNNESNLLSTNVIYNTDKPRISMDCDVDYSVWTNKDVTFHTNVTDEKSGLKEVTYSIDGKQVKKVVFDELVNTYDFDLTADKTADKVSGYSMVIEVTNNCGTSNTMSRQVYIDKVKPKVTLSGIEKGAHYNNNQTFSTSVQEVSFKNTKTVYYITRTLDGKTYNMSSAVFHSDKYEDVTNRKMMKEGAYQIYAITTDSAGNTAKSNTLSFVIDKTAPKVSVSGTSEGSMNGSAVTLDFECVESFFATNTININVEKTLDGNTVTQSIEGFPKKAKNQSMSHSFSDDGTYKVTIASTDKAGNVATPQTLTFSVDTTKPQLQISGTGNYEQWDKPATIQFTVEESYYSNNEVSITGIKTDIDGNVSEVVVPKLANSGKVSNLSHTFSEDGIYELEMVSKDEAGNRESSEIHFTIDQLSPQVMHVEDYDGGYYQSFKLADTLEDVFKDLTVINYRMLLNGVEYNGIDEITDEGKYNLFVEVADELGHKTLKNIEFIIDHTAPKVIFSGVKDGESVRESGTVYLALTNTDDIITSIRMNGVEYDSNIRSLPFTEYGSYKIDVDCTDQAGNEVTRSIYFVYNNPLTVAIAVGGMSLLIIGTCIWLWIRTKRKEEEEKKI